MIGLGPRRSTHTWRPYLGGRWDRDDPGHHPEIPWYHAAIHPDDKNALNKLFRLEEMGPRTRRTSKEDRLGQLWLEGGSFRCAPIPVPRRHMGTEDPHRQYRLQGGSRICGATPDRKKPGQRAGPVWEHRHASFRARGPPWAQDDLRQCSLSPPGFDLRLWHWRWPDRDRYTRGLCAASLPLCHTLTPETRGPHTVSADACMTTRRVRTGEGLRRSVSPSRQGNPPQTWTPRTAHRATTYVSPCTHMYFIFVCYRSKVDVLLHWPRGGRRKLWWPDATTVYCTTRAPPLSRPDTRLRRNIRHNPATVGLQYSGYTRSMRPSQNSWCEVKWQQRRCSWPKQWQPCAGTATALTQATILTKARTRHTTQSDLWFRFEDPQCPSTGP